MKYISYKSGIGMTKMIAWTDVNINHSDMAQMLSELDDTEQQLTGVVGAGFVVEDGNGDIYCCGHSDTLHKQANEADTKVLHAMIKSAYKLHGEENYE